MNLTQMTIIPTTVGKNPLEEMEKRQNLYEAQDEVDARKETLLTKVEHMLEQKIEQTELFTIKWRVK